MKKKFSFINNFFKDKFAIEANVDITDDCQMLYRRNIVIKNIIFFSNIIYTAIFALLSIGQQSNWVFTIICFPITFVVNLTLKNLIDKNPKDMVKQTIASYFCVFYMFITAVLLYVKMHMGDNSIYSDSSYILIYYSLVVISLYQSPSMIKNIAPYLLVIVTILHFVITYDILHASYATDILSFIKEFFKSEEFRDIVLRTVMLAAFVVVLYSIVLMNNKMQIQRKEELIKRKAVQDDFTKVVTDMFDITLNGNQISEDEHVHANLLEQMVEHMASLYGMPPKDIEDCKYYSTIHLYGKVNLDVSDILDKDQQFLELKNQTNIGNIIVKRLELRRKCEDIIRAHEEGWATDAFIRKNKEIQNDKRSQVVLLCDLYITLRSPKNYKRSWGHSKSMELLENEYKIYFDDDIVERFIKFASDFDDIYNNYEEK